jgi:ferredoxin
MCGSFTIFNQIKISDLVKGKQMIRKIIKIDEELCDGCGDCVPACAEGAIQIIDGKARLISDLFCDGLGACLGHCHAGAITVEEREAEPYNEEKVMEYIIKGGENVIKAHLLHLLENNEDEYYRQAVGFLDKRGIKLPSIKEESAVEIQSHSGCPGSKAIAFESASLPEKENGKRVSHLTQWPVQMHLISPNAAYYKNSDLLLAADCVPIAYADFHKDFMQGKSIAIACPKLDTNKQVYLDKMIKLIDDAEVKSITVAVMQVPCCNGLFQLAQQAIEYSGKEIPLKIVVVGINGNILHELNN